MRAAVMAAAVIILLCLSSARAGDTRYEPQWREGVIATNSHDELLPLYRDPSASSPTLGGYYAGVPVLFLGEPDGESGLVPVRVGGSNGSMPMAGYMERSRLIECDPSDPDPDKPVPYSPVLVVKNPSAPGWLNLRESPSTDSRVIEQLPNGSLATVLGVVGEWLHVETENARGYMSPLFLSPIAQARTLSTDEFTFGPDGVPLVIQLLHTGDGSPEQIVRVLDDRHDVVQIITVQCAGRLDRDANFVLEDMNFDGYPDFRTLSDYSNNETRFQYWLFDPDANPDDPVNPWRFVRAESYEALPNEPVFDAQVQRIYTRVGFEYPGRAAWIDSVYDLHDGAPRLIESLHTSLISGGVTLYQLYELQGDAVELMHEWEVRPSG